MEDVSTFVGITLSLLFLIVVFVFLINVNRPFKFKFYTKLITNSTMLFLALLNVVVQCTLLVYVPYYIPSLSKYFWVFPIIILPNLIYTTISIGNKITNIIENEVYGNRNQR